MKYTWYINYIKCKEFWLKINQGAIMDLMTHLPLWADAEVIDWEIYYYFTTQKIIEELPIISDKKRTILANVQILKEKWLLSHKIHNNKGYYKLTELWKTFIFDDKKISVQNSAHLEEGMQKNAYKYAEKCTPGVQKNAYNNNTSINNNNKISKDILLEKNQKSFFNFFEELKILKNYKFDFSKFEDKNWEKIFENEEFCRELHFFYKMRKDMKAPMTARALELLCMKSKNYDLDIFIKMIQQSTENSWKWIFELKNNFQNFWKNNPGVVISTSGEPPYCASYEEQKAERLKRLEEYKKQHPNE